MDLPSSSCTPSCSASDSSDESSLCYKYDVFLNFRGKDTRKGIICNLYYELEKTESIRTFKDDEKLEIGMPISNIMRAIRESRLVIVVLSSNYASSTWCLEELVHAFECMEGKDRILPVFYDEDPSDVRNQRGSFGAALYKHEQNLTQDQNKVKQWRIALGKVGTLSGWDTRNFRSERELVKNIVEFVCRKVPAKVSSPPAAKENKNLEQKKLHFSVGPYGSNARRLSGGKKFDDYIHSTVRQLVIGYDDKCIWNIKIEYDLNGESFWSATHGISYWDPDNIATLTLDYPDEYLTSMHGCYRKIVFLSSDIDIRSLTFTSNKRTFGPFGDQSAKNNFSVNVPNSMIVGFHGQAGRFTGLRAIGAHLKHLA